MLLSAWLFIGVLALLASGVAIATEDNGIAMVAGTLGFVLWGLWAFGALNVEVVDNGSTLTFELVEVAIVGFAMAMIPGYIALTGPIELISRHRDPDVRDI